MHRYPNPMQPTLRTLCAVCGDPSGRMTCCCSTCAEDAYYATTCGEECACESLAAHEDSLAEMERDFLRDPGPPPAHMSEASVAKARAGMSERRAALGMK